MNGWALLVPTGRDIAPVCARAGRPVTTVVRTVRDGLELVAAGQVAGLLVLDYGELAGVVELVDPPGPDGPVRPRRLTPGTAAGATRRPARAGSPAVPAPAYPPGAPAASRPLNLRPGQNGGLPGPVVERPTTAVSQGFLMPSPDPHRAPSATG